MLVDILTVFHGNTALQHRFIRDRMIPLGKIAQIANGCGLAGNPRLGIELLAIKREASFNIAEIVAQLVNEFNVCCVRLDIQIHGPGDFGHAVDTLGKGSRFRSSDATVFDGNLNRPHAREHYRNVVARASILVFKFERKNSGNVNVRGIAFEPLRIK